jgi:hypothetical protein
MYSTQNIEPNRKAHDTTDTRKYNIMNSLELNDATSFVESIGTAITSDSGSKLGSMVY